MGDTPRFVREDRLLDLCVSLFRAVDVPEDHARRAARVLVDADLRGVSSHGIRLLPWNIRRLRGGGVKARPNVREVSNAGAIAILDGDAGIGMTIGSIAMERAIDVAREQGIGWVMARNTNHYGASASFSLMAVEQGMIGISISNSGPMMTIEGAAERAIGNNPFAIGIPTPEFPMVLDMATSVASIGKIGMTRRAGREIPESWLVKDADDTGRMVLRHFGGPKGSGLAIMTEALTGVLSGGRILNEIAFNRDAEEPHGVTHTQIAIDPESILPAGAFAERAKQLVDELHAAPLAPGFDEILLPGERAWRETLRQWRDGIALEPDAAERLDETAAELGVALPWEGADG